MEEIKDDRQTVYEIGYLIASSIPEDKVLGEAEAVKAIITGAGASIISEEAPHFQELAYSMRVKMVSGAYEKYDTAYFGWIKFELGSSKIEAIKKAVETKSSILRMLLITTVREETYLGKRAPILGAAGYMNTENSTPDADEKKEKAPVSIEQMDKSIEEMIK